MDGRKQIICENAVLGYEGKSIIEGLNFSVQEGDYLCIVGENGSGKTTLMRTLLHLQMPLRGKIEYADGLQPNQVGYLPQQTIVQKDFPASVQEIVLSGCQNRCGIRPFYSKQQKDKMRQAMEKMQISHLAKQCYRELSGGQQQRVLLARALCATSKILLLDEPVAGLDPNVTTELYQIISELNTKDKITIIMISHDIPQVLKYATHILHMNVRPFFGTREEYICSEFGKLYAYTGGEQYEWGR